MKGVSQCVCVWGEGGSDGGEVKLITLPRSACEAANSKHNWRNVRIT